MRTLVIAVGLLAFGCGKKDSSSSSAGGGASPSAPSDTAAADALWAMAPEGATVAIVVSPRAIAMTEHAWQDIRKLLADAPELAAINVMLGAQITQIFGKPDVTLADVGLSPTKGGAFFVTPGGGGIAIVPVGDRDKFVAATHGTKADDGDKIGKATCKQVNDSYICASSADQFGKVGKAKLKGGLDPLGTRGDVEVVASFPMPGGSLGNAAAVLQLSRGAFVARARVSGLPTTVTSKIAGAQSKARGDLGKTSGFGVINLGPMLASAPPIPIVAGVTFADLGKSIGGPVTLNTPAGTLGIDIRVPLNDPKPMATLFEHCAELGPLAEVGATFSDGACHVMVPSLGYPVDFWVDGQEARVGKKGQDLAGTAVAMTPIGEELAKTPALFSFWGRGTLFGPMTGTQFPKLPAMPAELLMMIRGLSMLNELGGSVNLDGDIVKVTFVLRTAWSNPDDVVAKLVAIKPEAFLEGKAADAAKAIADGAKSAPFAADYTSGTGGLMAPMAVAGMLAAVAIPAFMDYMKKGKKSEAALQLNKLAKNAKVYYATESNLPTLEAPLTPPTPCCEGPNHKCAPAGAGWMNQAWTALDFQIDEPTMFQYRMKSDGKTLHAEAIGDLDCDGNMITYSLDVTTDNGNASAQITEPPPSSD